MNKHTPFYSLHQSLNAKILPFAGYLMPIQYKGVNFEHNHVRNCVGVFDVSHMSQITIKGPNSINFLQKITTNDVSKLIDGKVQYTCMLNNDGGIIDDLLLYRFNQDYFMLVVNASNADKNIKWLHTYNNLGVDINDVTESRGILAIQGPKAYTILKDLTDLNLNSIPYYNFKVGKIANCPDVIISNTGYTGSGGFELYMPRKHAVKIWQDLFAHNSILEPIGLAARDTLRLEMGYCLYGNDINEEISPIQAGLSWIVNMQKDFIGKEVLAQQVKQGVSFKLIAFKLTERGIPRKDYEIVDKQGNHIGEVTSGTMSPSLKIGIGMGFVLAQESIVNNHIFIQIRHRRMRAKIIKLPFYEK